MTDVDSLDWKDLSPEQLTQNVLKKVTDGSMHNVKRLSPTEGNSPESMNESPAG